MGSDTSGLTTLVWLTVNVSYRRDWKMCDINGNVYSEVELVHEDGCFSSNISPWSQALVGKCANHSCMEGYKFALKGDGITCKLAYCIGMPNVATALLHEPFGLYRDLGREIVACPDLAPVNFATITAETGKNYQGTITYACNRGYELMSGDLTRQCQDDKAWSGSPPVCEAVVCPDLRIEPINFATITAETGKNYQDTITYACNRGYELKSGDLTRQCQDDKAWSGSPPVCEIVACPDLAPVNFATITAETGKNYQGTITYACNRGYELMSGDLTRQCQDDKAWSGSPPVCEAVVCPDLRIEPINFATITDKTGTSYKDKVTYACITNYVLKTGDLTRQCFADKTWSGSPPVCKIVACPDLTPVNFATITAETGKNYQGTITYACNRGYELKSGDLTRQCQDDKAWSGSPPVCEAVVCPDLRIEPINFATITDKTGTSYKDKVTYACITNYVLKTGDLTRQCFADKTWSGSPPVCSKNTEDILTKNSQYHVTVTKKQTNFPKITEYKKKTQSDILEYNRDELRSNCGAVKTEIFGISIHEGVLNNLSGQKRPVLRLVRTDLSTGWSEADLSSGWSNRLSTGLVWGRPVLRTGEGSIVSQIKKTGQSTIYDCEYGFVCGAEKGVDGIKEPKSMFHTRVELEPFWWVNLGQVYKVQKVISTNQMDNYGHRLTKMLLHVGIDTSRMNVCGQFIGPAVNGQVIVIRCNTLPEGQIVKLTSFHTAPEFFHLAEVEVYAV
ncbi:Hypothetical predicted protein [Mytilus galloprovincialis]|uniref:Sushi domain-containing protein n=1 Tax=Mytilus galloprovincialis TaxID=29158 RepID=A0A8B6FWL8_MYTGA|nr:Hypothetical predicted protein [Mytilus galloprovincialis]